MNYCNFAKILIARSTKDKTSIDLFNTGKPENKDAESRKPCYNTSLSLRQRFENYSLFVHKYPKMHVKSYDVFRTKAVKLQKFTYESKYYANNNHNGEREQFLQQFSFNNWWKLTEMEKKQHKLEDCSICPTKYLAFSALHTGHKTPSTAINLKQSSTDLVENVKKAVSTTPSCSKVAKAVVQVINPIFESEFNTNFESAFAESFHLSPKETIKEKNIKIKETLQQSNKSITNALEENNNDVHQLLSSGKSFKMHDRERMMYFTTKSQAEQRLQQRLDRESKGILKPKKHHGKLTNIKFDRQNFLQEVSSLKEGSIVNWTGLARKYNLKNQNNKLPSNAGQIVMSFAKENGIDIYKFNKHNQVSGRDILRRIRRAKKRLFKSKVSIPVPRSGKVLKAIVKKNIEEGIINLGQKIAPKTFTNNTINKEGNLVQTTSTVYGRKIPLVDIVSKENERLDKAGVLRIHSDNHYDQMTREQLQQQLDQLHEEHLTNETTDTLRDRLKKIQRTRYIKVWHDHSDILNHTYVNFMISFIYDPANFLTNDEFIKQNPSVKRADVQKIVERPQLYILGQSGTRC